MMGEVAIEELDDSEVESLRDEIEERRDDA